MSLSGQFWGLCQTTDGQAVDEGSFSEMAVVAVGSVGRGRIDQAEVDSGEQPVPLPAFASTHVVQWPTEQKVGKQRTCSCARVRYFQ